MTNKGDKLKNWLKNPYNLGAVAVVILALIIRLYFLFNTNGQTLWWDEAEYGSMAKHYLLDVPYELNPQRPFLFPFIAGILMLLSISEAMIKFLIVVIPSTLLVGSIYFLGKEMYNEKVGLIGAILATFSWTFVFWSARFQPDFLSMLFSVLSIMFMWMYWKSPSRKLIIYSGVFAALGFMFKVSGLLVPLMFLVFMIIKDRIEMFKKKDYYIFTLSFFLTLVPQFIYSKFALGSLMAFLTKSGYAAAVVKETKPFGWYNLKFFYLLTENMYFILFIIGLILGLRFLLYLDVLAKEKNKCFDANLFAIVALVVVAAFYIFYIRGTEDRWVFLWLPFIFYFIGNALIFVHDLIKPMQNTLAIIVIVGLLVFGAYGQLMHAKTVIDSRKESYAPVKAAALWLKDHSDKNDEILSISYPQTTYYSERKVTLYAERINSEEEFDMYVRANKPRFLIVSAFEPHPPWIQPWIVNNQNMTKPVQAYFEDEQKQRPLLIVYEVMY